MAHVGHRDDGVTARLTLLLPELRLPATKQIRPAFAEQSDKEGWPAARLLTVLVENELAERDRRRIERHLAELRDAPQAGHRSDVGAKRRPPHHEQRRALPAATRDPWTEAKPMTHAPVVERRACA